MLSSALYGWLTYVNSKENYLDAEHDKTSPTYEPNLRENVLEISKNTDIFDEVNISIP